MGKHRAMRISGRELRVAYVGLRTAYERLLRRYRALELDHALLLEHATAGGVPPEQDASHLLRDAVPLGVDEALRFVRDSGLLFSPGLGDDRAGYID